MNNNIRPCLVTELDMLQKIGYETSKETYRSVINQETMDNGQISWKSK